MYFGGDVKGESAIKTEEEIGSLIDYEFRVIIVVGLSYWVSQYNLIWGLTGMLKMLILYLQIINLGKPLKSFGTASLNIQWPKENVDGKWLLYLVKISSTGLEEIPCSPETEINSLKHVQVIHS